MYLKEQQKFNFLKKHEHFMWLNFITYLYLEKLPYTRQFLHYPHLTIGF